MCKERKQVFRVCYLVRTRAMAQMARVNFVRVTIITCLHSNVICMIIVQLCTVDCIVYCCKQHRSLYRPLYSVKTIDIVCRRSRSVAIFNIVYIYSLLSVRLELPVAESIKQHHVYSVRTIKIFPYVII